jgi:hypothetical protein
MAQVEASGTALSDKRTLDTPAAAWPTRFSVYMPESKPMPDGADNCPKLKVDTSPTCTTATRVGGFGLISEKRW